MFDKHGLVRPENKSAKYHTIVDPIRGVPVPDVQVSHAKLTRLIELTNAYRHNIPASLLPIFDGFNRNQSPDGIECAVFTHYTGTMAA